MQFDAVARGNHFFAALVVMKDVMDRVASAKKLYGRFVALLDGECFAGCGKAVDYVIFGQAELGG